MYKVMDKQINQHTEWSLFVSCLLWTQPTDQRTPTVFLLLPRADVVSPNMTTPGFQQTFQPLASSQLVQNTHNVSDH